MFYYITDGTIIRSEEIRKLEECNFKTWFDFHRDDAYAVTFTDFEKEQLERFGYPLAAPKKVVKKVVKKKAVKKA